jgi:hypothetical protein
MPQLSLVLEQTDTRLCLRLGASGSGRGELPGVSQTRALGPGSGCPGAPGPSPEAACTGLEGQELSGDNPPRTPEMTQ